LTDNFSFGWEAFNNITKDAKGNFLQLGWEKSLELPFWRNCSSNGWFGFQFCSLGKRDFCFW
jgi:hypothetical protein